MYRRLRFSLIGALLLTAVLSILPMGIVSAATFEVDSLLDTSLTTCSAAANDCTLRGAITRANNASGADNITFNAAVFATPQTITIGSALPAIIHPLTIDGLGNTPANVTIAGNGTFNGSLLSVSNSSVTLQDLTLQGGRDSTGFSNGGALVISGTSPTVNLRRMVFNDNQANNGGAIYLSGASSSVNIFDTRFTNNEGDVNGLGGALFVQSGATARIFNSLFTGNNAARGSAIYVTATSSSVQLINVTFSGNDTDNREQWRSVVNNIGNVTLRQVTFRGARDAFQNSGSSGTANIANSVLDSVGANSSFVCAGGTFNDLGGNVIEDAGSCTFGSNSTVGTDPGLLTLANNGGLTPTHALGVTSVARNYGLTANLPADPYDLDGDANTTEALPVDGRGVGFARVVGANPDAGAFEAEPVVVTPSFAFTTGSASVPETTPILTEAGEETIQETISVTVELDLASGTTTEAITVSLAASGTADAGDYILSATSVTFPPGSVDGAQQVVTLTPIDDTVTETDETVTLTLSVSGGTATVGTPNLYTLTVIDNDAPVSIAFAQGAANTFVNQTIAPAVMVEARNRLNQGISNYTGSVTLALAANPGGAVLSGTLTQNIASGVAAFPDLSLSAIGAGYTITATSGAFAATSGYFNVTAPGTVVLTRTLASLGVTDDVSAVAEGHETGDRLALRLSARPNANVTVTLTSASAADLRFAIMLPTGALTFSPTHSVTFTRNNWSTWQAINLSAVADGVADAGEVVNVTLTTSSADLRFHNLALPTEPVTIYEPGVELVPAWGALIPEGMTATYTLHLLAPPGVALTRTGGYAETVTLVPRGFAGTVLTLVPFGARVAFNRANWNTPQIVTLQAIEDAGYRGAQYSTTLEHGVISSVPNTSLADTPYGGPRLPNVTVAPVTVTMADNDGAPLIDGTPPEGDVINLDSAANWLEVVSIGVPVTEGGVVEAFAVRLTSPVLDGLIVTIDLTPDGNVAAVAPTRLVFDATNWNASQTVLAMAADDTMIEGAHVASVRVSVGLDSTDTAFVGREVWASVFILDNEVPLTAEPLPLNMEPGIGLPPMLDIVPSGDAGLLPGAPSESGEGVMPEAVGEAK